MTTSRAQSRRARLTLPREQSESFRRGLEHVEVPGAAVLVGWITQAARYAHEGRYELLPPQSSAPQSADRASLYYTMSAEESEDVARALSDAGSSVRAVVAACIGSWEAAGYSLVRMQWPRREQFSRAA